MLRRWDSSPSVPKRTVDAIFKELCGKMDLKARNVFDHFKSLEASATKEEQALGPF
jgi:hypothetical protein